MGWVGYICATNSGNDAVVVSTEGIFLPSYVLQNPIARVAWVGLRFAAPAFFLKLVDLTSENKHHGDLKHGN